MGDVHERVVNREGRVWQHCAVPRQVNRADRDHAGHRSVHPEHGHALALELLIEQGRRRSTDSTQSQIPFGRDPPDRVADFVDRAGEQTARRALSEDQDHVPGRVARTPVQPRGQGVTHRLFVAGDRRHAREPDGERIQGVSLGRESLSEARARDHDAGEVPAPPATG